MAGNIVPRADGSSNLGTADKEFGTIYAKNFGGTIAGKIVTTDSPAFTGTPTAPTAAEGTQTTQLATTEFVQTANAGMEQLIKQYVANELAKYLPLTGGALTGSTIKRAVDNGFLDLYGGTGWTSGGAAISLNGKDRAGATAGAFGVRVNNGAASKEMWLKPDGSFTLDNKEIKSMAFPSATSVNCNITASGQAYTAPANGYVYLQVIPTAVNQSVALAINNNIVRGVSVSTNTAVSIFAPVKKGMNVYFYFAGNIDYCRFVYAEGEV